MKGEDAWLARDDGSNHALPRLKNNQDQLPTRTQTPFQK